MKIAIMQPYFFPYLGYFDLLHSVDVFLVYDTVQYIRRGWIHRNRILHQSGKGWQYIIVPTENSSQKTPILDICILDEDLWKNRLHSQLLHYNNVAPYADETINFVKDSLAVNEKRISRLNVSILSRCASLLKLNFEYRFCSELGLELDWTHTAEERILDLCEFLGAKEYVNLPGGVDLYQPEEFKRRNIKLTFRNLPAFAYDTGRYAFEPNLSIIDLLMWNNPKVINTYLNEHQSTGKK